MSDSKNKSANQKIGLFLLQLQSESDVVGAPILHLNLTVDTPHRQASGFAEVTQPLAEPIVCKSHVSGPVIYETVMGPGSKVRIDLSGYPNISWPSQGGVGPVIPKNFVAQVLLEPNFESGEVIYQFLNQAGQWVEERQKIVEVNFERPHLVAKAG